MTQDVNILFLDMSPKIPAYIVCKADMSYTIVINSRLSRERQLQTYHREMKHIENGNFKKKCSDDLTEYYVRVV